MTKRTMKRDERPQFSYALMLSLQQHTCFYCPKKLDSVGFCKKTAKHGYTRDHFFSQAMGNKHLLGNMVLACDKCNRKKGSGLPTRDEVHKYHHLWSQIRGGPSMDLSEFFEIQRLIDILENICGPRVDTRYII